MLAKAGVLQNRAATVWVPADKETVKCIEAHGARFTNEKNTVCGNVVTAMDPSAAEQFGETMGTLEVGAASEGRAA